MKIIIADDEEYVRLELREMLLEIDPKLSITEVVNGTRLLEAVKNRFFDVAFVDIKMPGFTGLEVIESIVPENLKTEWIILTGYANFDFAKKAISLGVTEYLLKPVSSDEIGDILEKINKKNSILEGAVTVSSLVSGRDTIHLVRSAERIVRERYSEQIGIAQIADELGVTPNYLSSLYRKFTGITFTKHITNIRMTRALELLKRPGINVKEITSLLGYTSSRHFARVFRAYYNISPSEYIQKYRN